MQSEEPINFYRKEGDYGFLSNFYKSPFQLGQTNYQTNQHYFQSKKFEGKPYEQQVASAKTPKQAFDLGRSRDHPIRPDWQEAKQKVMYEGLKAKFTQNQDLKAKILATGARPLVQHTSRDKYWGDGGNGSGKNRLGILLMQLRDEFRG